MTITLKMWVGPGVYRIAGDQLEWTSLKFVSIASTLWVICGDAIDSRSSEGRYLIVEVILWSRDDHCQQCHFEMEVATNFPLYGWNDIKTCIAACERIYRT